MSDSGLHEPSWAERSGWTLAWEIKRWAKHVLSGIPGRLGSTLRCRFYGFGSCASDVFIAEHFLAEYPKLLHIGEHTGINRGFFVNAGGGVTIDSWVLIGPGVTIYSQNHDLHGDPKLPLGRRGDLRAPVHIGHGAVVTHDVPPHCVVAGVPARVIRELERAQTNESSAT